jgi:hypothetical protein
MSNEVYEYIKKNMEKWIDDINGLKEEIVEIFNMSINDKNQLLKDIISESNLDDMEVN